MFLFSIQLMLSHLRRANSKQMKYKLFIETALCQHDVHDFREHLCHGNCM